MSRYSRLPATEPLPPLDVRYGFSSTRTFLWRDAILTSASIDGAEVIITDQPTRNFVGEREQITK